MDPELKHLVQETFAMAKENHRLLNAVRRHQIFETFGKWILWAIVILASAYSFQVYLRPLVEPLLSAQGSLRVPTSAEIKKLIDSYKVGN